MNTENHKFIEIIDSFPLASIDLIIRNPNKDVLLGNRTNRPAQGFWFVPGGRIHKNETIRDAIKRISQTGIGLDLSDHDPGLLGASEHIYEDNYLDIPDITTHYVVLVFVIDLESEIMVSCDDQHSKIKCWVVEELLGDEMVHPNTRDYLKS